VDSSNENGELETNDTDYAYDYLMMPRTVKELAAVSMKALKLIYSLFISFEADFMYECLCGLYASGSDFYYRLKVVLENGYTTKNFFNHTIWD
jgi:hypothetical protein